jgi:hypothetical protein
VKYGTPLRRTARFGAKFAAMLDRDQKLEARSTRMANLMEIRRGAPEVARGVIERVIGAAPAVPKDVAAKPGKGTPTKAEREWLDAITAYGCIACRIDGSGFRPAAVHHIVRGGQRLGHLFALPLCDPGHHQNGKQFGMVSRHPWKAEFEKRYGCELDLLERLRAEMGGKS